ncbi:MAG: hypothetical protein R2710_20910 [Acidimicrobiales bacterium]
MQQPQPGSRCTSNTTPDNVASAATGEPGVSAGLVVVVSPSAQAAAVSVTMAASAMPPR